MKNIEALIDDGGEITIGSIGPIACAATAADGHNALAMLVRRDGETLARATDPAGSTGGAASLTPALRDDTLIH